MFAYCGNNPVNRLDPTGNSWFGWALAALVVVVAAVAVVATAGGAAAGIAAVAAVASGTAASSTAATVAAGVFIGSSVGFAASAYGAAANSRSIDEFADYGESAFVATVTGGLVGGVDAYGLTKPQQLTRELSDDELRNYGTPGKNDGFRVTNGSHEDALNFTATQTGQLTEYTDGKYMGFNSRGVEFRVYPRAGFGYSSIRIRGVSGLKGIKFIWTDVE